MAFFSGSNDALTYDSFKQENKESLYSQFVSNIKIIGTVGFIIAVIIGGLVFKINPRLPFILWGVTHSISFIISLFLSEPKIDSVKYSNNSFLSQNKNGFKQLFSKNLKPFVFFILSILGFLHLYDWGVIKPAVSISFGFQSVEMAILYSIDAFISIIIFFNFQKIMDKISDYNAMLIMNFAMILSIFALSFNIGLFSIPFIIILGVINSVSAVWIGIVVNKHVPSEYRATALSSLTFIFKIPFILGIIFISDWIDQGLLRPFLLATSIVLLIFAILEIIFTKKYIKNL